MARPHDITSNRRRVRLLPRAVVLALLCGVLWTFCLPLLADAALVGAAVGLFFVADARRLALVLASVVFGAIATEVAVRVLRGRQALEVHYREHEKHEIDSGYVSGRGRYRDNVNDTIDMRHGDSFALDPFVEPSIREPRRVRFRTDDRGHRNDAPYRGEKLILSGDSFVVGNTTTQEDTLPNVLRSAHAIDSYSIGHPGDPNLYFAMIQRFLDEVDGGASALLFLFEGNDFKTAVPVRTPGLPSLYDRWKLAFARRVEPFWRAPEVLFGVSRQAARRLLRPAVETVEVESVGSSRMGFYGPYIDLACAPAVEFQWQEPPRRVLERIRAVFFIPTNYRVYFPWLDDAGRRGRKLVEPAPAFTASKNYFARLGIPVVDLEAPLRRRAGELLAAGEHVWWRDDTHWNGHGIRVAADEAARFLRGGSATAAER